MRGHVRSFYVVQSDGNTLVCRSHLRSRANYELESYTARRSNSNCPIRAMEWPVKKIIAVYRLLRGREENSRADACDTNSMLYVHDALYIPNEII